LYFVGTLIFTGGCFAVAAPSRDFTGLYPTGFVFMWLMLLAQPYAIFKFWQLRLDTRASPPTKGQAKAAASSPPKDTFSAVTPTPTRKEEPPTRTIPRAEKKEEPPSRNIPMPEGRGAPPPPPARGGPATKWKMGDDCQAIWNEDGAWYKAKITAVKGGGKYQVLFTEYGQSQEVTDDTVRTVR